MQGRGRPQWQEQGQQEQGVPKHVKFHESVKTRPPPYDYPRPYGVSPPPRQPRMRGPPPDHPDGRWMYEGPSPPAPWQGEYYESPPHPHPPQRPTREGQQRYSPLQPKRPYMPPMHSHEGRRPPPEYEQSYRPPRIPYRRAPPEEFYPPSPKRARTQPPPPTAEGSQPSEGPGASLSLLAKVASQGESPHSNNKSGPPPGQTPSGAPPPRFFVPPSPDDTPNHQRGPMAERWTTPSQAMSRTPPSPPHSVRREFYPPHPPAVMERQPSWTMSPGSVAVIERGSSFEHVESPPHYQQYGPGNAYPFGYYSPEGHSYNMPPRYARQPPMSVGWRGEPVYGPNHVSPTASYEEAQPPPYAPYTYVQQPRLEEKTMLRKKFSWRHYPELERFLISNRDEYLRHSAMNYTAEQKQYNNWLTERVLEVADQYNYEFDPEEFNFVAIRDRIRCYYKSYVQTARKQGLPILPPSKQSSYNEDTTLEAASPTKGEVEVH